jgi:TetR/AcrR family transcriptional regulator
MAETERRRLPHKASPLPADMNLCHRGGEVAVAGGYVAKDDGSPKKDAKPKRGRGRPQKTEDNVGRAAFIAATRKLLETTPPAKLTTAMIAREAGADPALLRYYFGDRQSLLYAVVEDMLGSRLAAPPLRDVEPAERLAASIRRTGAFAQKARSMQRLMIDELVGAKSSHIRDRMKELNAAAVSRYAQLFEDGEDLAPVDPLFLYVAIIGMSEFFASAQPMIRPLAPGVSASDLADRYTEFVVKLGLDGLRPR